MSRIRLAVSKIGAGLVILASIGLLALLLMSIYGILDTVVMNDTPGLTLREAMGLPR